MKLEHDYHSISRILLCGDKGHIIGVICPNKVLQVTLQRKYVDLLCLGFCEVLQRVIDAKVADKLIAVERLCDEYGFIFKPENTNKAD